VQLPRTRPLPPRVTAETALPPPPPKQRPSSASTRVQKNIGAVAVAAAAATPAPASAKHGTRNPHDKTDAKAGGTTSVAAAAAILGCPEVIATVRAFIVSYLDPLTHMGVVGADASRAIADKATAKVMRKHASLNPKPSTLEPKP